MSESLWKKILTKSFWLYFFTFLIAPSGYLIKMFISRTVSVEELGVFYGFLSLLTFLTTYNDLGMTQSLSYFVPRLINKWEHKTVGSFVGIALFMQVGVWALIVWALYLLKHWLEVSYFGSSALSEIFYVFLIYFLIINIYEVIVWFFSSLQDTFLQKLVELVRIWAIVGIVAYSYYIWTSSLNWYACAWLFWTILAILIGIVCVLRYHSKYFWTQSSVNYNTFKDFFKYAFWIFVGLNASNLLWHIDMQMILVMLGPESAWYYSNYLSLLQIPQVISGPILAFLFAVFSQLSNQETNEKSSLLLSILHKYFTTLGVIIWVYLLVFWPLISSLLFWIQYETSWVLLRYVALFIPIYYLFSINFSVLPWLGQAKKRTFILLIWVAINVVLNYVFIPIFGTVWAIFGTICWWIMFLLITQRLLIKTMNISTHWQFTLKNIFLVLSMNLWVYYTGIPEHISQLNVSVIYKLVLLVSIAIWQCLVILLTNYREVSQLKELLFNKKSKTDARE